MVFNKAIQGIHNFKRQQAEIWMNIGGGGALTFTDPFGTPSTNVFATGTAATVNGNLALGLSFLFRLQDVLNPGEFTTLFDSFKINGVSLAMENMTGNHVNTGAGISVIPEIYHVLDYDDATPPPTQATTQQYENCKQKRLEQTKKLTRYFVPKVADLAFKTSGTTVGFTHRNKNPWVDCVNSDTEHYGLKMWINNIDPVQGTTIRFQFLYYLSFRTVR